MYAVIVVWNVKKKYLQLLKFPISIKVNKTILLPIIFTDICRKRIFHFATHFMRFFEKVRPQTVVITFNFYIYRTKF